MFYVCALWIKSEKISISLIALKNHIKTVFEFHKTSLNRNISRHKKKKWFWSFSTILTVKFYNLVALETLFWLAKFIILPCHYNFYVETLWIKSEEKKLTIEANEISLNSLESRLRRIIKKWKNKFNFCHFQLWSQWTVMNWLLWKLYFALLNSDLFMAMNNWCGFEPDRKSINHTFQYISW